MTTEQNIIAALVAALATVLLVLIFYAMGSSTEDIKTFKILGYLQANNYGKITLGSVPSGETVPSMWFGICNKSVNTNAMFKLRLENGSGVYHSDIEVPLYFPGCTNPELMFYFDAPLTGRLSLHRMDLTDMRQYYEVDSRDVSGITRIKYESTETVARSWV